MARMGVARYPETTRCRGLSDQSDRSDWSDKAAPACPLCGKPMRRREARTGLHAGEPFWGCSGWPECRGLLTLDR